MVDPSLLRQAADRGVTICFADLDGADGLWVPEERTVLVSRGLSEERVAEVIEHELAHVMIDDQHADLDAGKDVLVGKPALSSRRPAAAALAAASLLVLIGGVTYGVNRATGDTKLDRVAPNPNGPGLTADESASATPTAGVVRVRGPHGEIINVTLTPTPGTPIPTRSATRSPSLSPSATRPAPQRTRQTTAPTPRTTTSPTPPVESTDSPATTPAQPTETEPSPTTPPDESGGAGEGGLGDGSGQDGDGGLGTGTSVVDATAADAAPVGSTTP